MQSRARIVLIDWVCVVLLFSAGGCYLDGTQARPSRDYTIKRGDTLYTIGQRFGSSVEELRRVNRISDPRNLQVGQNLKVPAGTQSYRGGAQNHTQNRGQGRAPNRSAIGGGTNLPIKTGGAPALRMVKLGAAQKHVRQMVWPLPKDSSYVSSKFNWRWSSFHEGIDLAAPSGTPVSAAHAGRVIFSGRRGGYGNLVIVRGENVLTVYGHNSRLRVSRGEQVERGELLGYVGSSGNASGPHLHFETRIWDPGVNGYVAVDPWAFYK